MIFRWLIDLRILLVSNILIGSDEQIEFAFGLFQQLAIFDSAPAALLRSLTLMTDQKFVHRPRHALVQKNLHAAAAERRNCSERSKILQAILRVTEGKHSKSP